MLLGQGVGLVESFLGMYFFGWGGRLGVGRLGVRSFNNRVVMFFVLI